MIIKGIDLNNFMIFSGKHSFSLTNSVNLIVGKNDSGKSILSSDAFKYVFLKRIRYKKIEHVLNNQTDKDDHGSVSISVVVDGLDMRFTRYLLHNTHKNNLCIESGSNPIFITGVDSFANVKNIPIQTFLKNLNVDLDHFDLVSVYNPFKDMIAEKKSVLDLLSIDFNSLISLFDVIYRTFDADLNAVQNGVESLEHKLGELTKANVVNTEVDRINDENEKISQKIDEFKGNKIKLSDALSRLSRDSGEISSGINQKKKDMQKWIDFYKSGVCHTCGRPFDGDGQKDKIRQSVQALKNDIIEADTRLKSLQTRISQIRNSIETLDSNIWKLANRSKENELKLVNNDAAIATMSDLVTEKRKKLIVIEERVLKFKRKHDAIFSQEEVNGYIRTKIQSFEQSYQEIYNILTQQSVEVKLNINKYEEPLFGDFLYSGLSTSKRRTTYLAMMLALHSFCDTKLSFLILDEFFDVFHFDTMVKILESIFSTNEFKRLQFIITSNNDDLIGLVKGNPINLINLIDYTKN